MHEKPPLILPKLLNYETMAMSSTLTTTAVKYCSTPDDARIMIAISGIPGSGKTGLATMMAARINKIHASENLTKPRPIAIAIPMDGYHLTRAQLAAMPDPDYAAARRGAAFTFDGEKFLSLVRDLRQTVNKRTGNLYAPSFDHAIKDPVDEDIVIPADCRVIFFEGNYLSLNREPWNTAAALMDELWFVDVDFEVARKRLVLRHVKAGIAKDEEEADKRARENDLVNGKEIVDERLPVQEVVSSIFDPVWEKL
jgi:pantothenate kinase